MLELSDYLRILRRYWITVIGCVCLGVGVAGAAALVTAPSYTAKTQLFVAIQSSGSVTELQQGNNFSQARVQSYVETARTPVVLQPVIDSLGLDDSAQELSERVQAVADLKTVLITITVVDSSPVQSAAIAQAVADSLIRTVDTLETPSGEGESPVRLSVVTPAAAPGAPSSPATGRYLMGGLLAGIVFGGAIALTRNALDTKVRSKADLKSVADIAVLGGITHDNSVAGAPLITDVDIQSPRAESFRQIRTNLKFANINSTSKAILVTSSLPGEGKSTTAVNLAITLSQSGQSVVLIDADLRRPRVADYLGLERNAGLTTALAGMAQVVDLLQPWGDDELHVLTSGTIPPNPSELLGSYAMGELIKELEDSFDAVIIDAPPLLPVTDASVIAQKVGGVLIVIGSSKVRVHDLQKAFDSLHLVDAKILGAVFNMLPAKGPEAYSYSYYTYSSEPNSKIQAKPRSRPARDMQGARYRTGRRASI